MSNQESPSMDSPYFWDWMGKCVAESDRDVVPLPEARVASGGKSFRVSLSGYFTLEEVNQIRNLAVKVTSVECKTNPPKFQSFWYQGAEHKLSILGDPAVTTIEGWFTHEGYEASMKVGVVANATLDT